MKRAKIKLQKEKGEEKMKGRIALLMVLMLASSLMAALPFSSASSTEKIFMTPNVNPVGTPYIGMRFNVTVWITDYANPNVFAYQFKLIIDDVAGGIKIVNAWRSEWDSRWIFTGRSTVGTAPAFYDTNGNGMYDAVLVGDSLLGGAGETPPPEPAILGIVEFEIVRAPGKYETLETVLNINNVDTFVLDGGLNRRYPVREDGLYRWEWQPPTTNPDVAIRPNTLIYDQYHNWTVPPHVFNVELYIENLDIGWALHNASVGITYNTPHAILELVSVTVNSEWAGPNTVDTSTPGEISIFVQGHPAPAGNVLVATITFKIIYQAQNPPQTAANYTDLKLHDVELFDTVGPIPYRNLIHGKVTVYPLLILPLAWFEIEPAETVLGPDLVVGDQYGKEFEIKVVIKGMHGTWKMIGYNIRVTYDPELMEIVSITEGDFLKDPRWNRYGTYFIAIPDDPGPYCPDYNIALGDLLFPAPGGVWNRYPGLWNERIIIENASKTYEPNFLKVNFTEIAGSMAPGTLYTTVDYSDMDHNGKYSVGDKIKLKLLPQGWTEWYTIKDVQRTASGGVILTVDQEPVLASGTLAIIRFKAIKQSWTQDFSAHFDIYPLFPPTYAIDKDFNDIPIAEDLIVNGTYTVKAIEATGRRIDVWMFNPPFGGQGLGQPADLVTPQTEITLTAKVTYNWWPVQYKKVTFEIRDNHGNLWAVLQDDTDDTGHAYVTFRMPWPCEGAEDLLGKWTVIASVTLADVVITDTMEFDYDYLIHIWKVTTDKSEYAHCETVKIKVEYGTKAMRKETVVLAVTVKDELGVPIGVVLTTLTVGGATYCTYKNSTITVSIHIPKWAYAGLATVHASFLSKLPSQGGEAVAQEVTKTFYILPI